MNGVTNAMWSIFDRTLGTNVPSAGCLKKWKNHKKFRLINVSNNITVLNNAFTTEFKWQNCKMYQISIYSDGLSKISNNGKHCINVPRHDMWTFPCYF